MSRETEIRLPEGGTVTYGDILDAVVATDSDPLKGSNIGQCEWHAIAQCVNQGIDSHLEAIIDADREFDNGEFAITPKNLCIVLRRLGETKFVAAGDYTEDQIWDAAHTLASSIFAVLGFDDYGKYVGRKALGLD